MKKLVLIASLITLGLFSCKKKENTVSQLVTYSTPTVSVNGPLFYSINVGDPLPAISSTAYDSFYRESYPVVVDQSTLDNTTPGLSIIYLKSRNKYGMEGSTAVYIAVTDIDDSYDLSGTYERSTNAQQVTVTKLARGLYVTNNVGGVLDVPGNESFIVPAYFVQTAPSAINMPAQQTPLGLLDGTSEGLIFSTTTTIQYVVQNGFFGTALRVFNKI